MSGNACVGKLFENVNIETIVVIGRGNWRLPHPEGQDPVVPLKTKTDSQENRLSTLYFQILTPMHVENSQERVEDPRSPTVLVKTVLWTVGFAGKDIIKERLVGSIINELLLKFRKFKLMYVR